MADSGRASRRGDSRRAVRAGGPQDRDSNPGLFSVWVRLRDTGELFSVPHCRGGTRVRDLKAALELQAGVPAELQRLSYLDQGDMPEESTLRYNDVVPGGTLTLTVWHYGGWAELVKAAAGGDERRLQSLVWESDTGKAGGQRAFSALFITAHRGHLMALRLLLHGGANVKMQTRLGRGPLHVAAAQGRTQCVEELLQGGAPAQQTDTDGLTPLCLATMLGQKGSVRQLCQFQWQQRAAGVRLRSHLEPGELLAHQRFDSRLKTWSRGPQAQMYMASLLRRGESQGTALGGPANRDVHSGDTDTAEHGRSAVHSCN